MALNKLYYVYGLDTACFYTDEENKIEKRLIRARCRLAKLKSQLPKRIKDKKNSKYDMWKQEYNKWQSKYYYRLEILYRARKNLKEELKKKIAKNKNIIRTARLDKILDKDNNPSMKRRVSIFDSSLTRCFELREREFNEEVVIIKVYFFDVAENIVNNGFIMNGHKYKFFSASAGQIRTKKLVAVREDLLNDNWNKLTAGLTVDKINSKGGMNINKFLAYLALCNSATDLWNGFDIDRCIVVEDFENQVQGQVDFIDDKTYSIERKLMKILIAHTDGCGMILPCLSKVNFMTRLPWVKGLLASFDFVKFIINNNCIPIVKDIYGQEHNIIEENIQIIFTKSQFKMWKFFDSWEEYKDNFKRYNCTAGKCNVEEEFVDSVINYQMIQTLSDMTDYEIRELAQENNSDLINLATDYKTMLKVFGADESHYNKNGFQKCLQKYPELLSDLYSRQTLKDLKKSLEKDLWSARFKIYGKYTFVIPDLYAVCEWLFLHIDSPKGVLKDGEVCCKLFDNNIKLDCLRSPSLYREHPVRINNIDCEYFNTDAIYVSCHDLISKILQFDSDGDRLLVSDNKTLISVAERNMKDIVPLFYNMSKASAESITSANLYKGLSLAYNGGNIGLPSNDITKIWNSGDITQEQLNVIKWLCLEVNFTID